MKDSYILNNSVRLLLRKTGWLFSGLSNKCSAAQRDHHNQLDHNLESTAAFSAGKFRQRFRQESLDASVGVANFDKKMKVRETVNA
jgi:hypothetical protein